MKSTRNKPPVLRLTSTCPKCGAPIYTAEDTKTKSADKVYTVSEPVFTCQCRLEIKTTTTPSDPYNPFPWYQPNYNPHWHPGSSNTFCVNGGPTMTSGYMRVIGPVSQGPSLLNG